MAEESPMYEDWMITCAYSVAEMLPTDAKEAQAVLAIVHDLIEKVNKPYLALRRRPRLVGSRSGAAAKRRPKPVPMSSPPK